MPTSKQRSIYESRIAAAHRACYHAQAEAEAMNDHGAAEDLQQILQHLSKLLSDSLRGKHKAQLKGQTSLSV